MDTTQLVWIIAVTVLTLLNIVWQFDLQTRQRRLRERYERLLTGSEEGGTSAGLGPVLNRLAELEGQVGHVSAATRQIQAILGHSVQGIGMVRFRAFQDTGGDQSFALALVDGEGNGAVVAALYAREGTRVYGKPLTAWNSTYNLGDEEKQALEQARQMVQGS